MRKKLSPTTQVVSITLIVLGWIAFGIGCYFMWLHRDEIPNIFERDIWTLPFLLPGIILAMTGHVLRGGRTGSWRDGGA